MGWRGSGLVCAVALVAGSSAWSAPAILNPDWLKKPNGEDLSDAYPAIASTLSLSGRAVIRCLVDARGGLRDCEVESESPAGFGFGEAALSLSRAFIMRPLTVAGTPVEGGEVRIPIAFRLPAEDMPEAQPTDPPPAAASLTLARQAVIALRVMDAVRSNLATDLHDLQARPSVVDPAIRAAALTAYRETMDATAQTVTETMARVYANTFTAQQLRDIAASSEPPEGAASYASPQGLAMRLFDARVDGFNATFRAGLHDRFCSRWPCAAGATTPPPTGANR